MNLNLEALGITTESLTAAILKETGLTREEAVIKLAEELGVDIAKSEDVTVTSGDKVLTSEGESVAAILKPSEIATLREAAEISSRIFS